MYEKDFSNHVFQLKPGDRIYSFTDGYPDQFGGEEGKKFNAKRFKEFLLDIRNNSMEKQKELITDNNILKEETSSIIVFPNPTAGIVNLSQECNWEVKNLQGITVSSGKGNAIDLSGYGNGVYLVKIGDEVERIIKL